VDAEALDLADTQSLSDVLGETLKLKQESMEQLVAKIEAADKECMLRAPRGEEEYLTIRETPFAFLNPWIRHWP
jgi:hypothetical protein